MFFVYVLRSESDQGYHIGHTNDLEDRLMRHNQGRVRSTKSRRPFAVVHVEVFESRSEAMRREAALKRLMGNRTFRKLIGV